MTAFESRIVGGMELRAGDQGDEMALVGYAALFNSLSGDLGGFRETIAPGAFSRALKEKQDVRFLHNHDSNFLCGRVGAGTLTLAEDSKGLAFRCQLDRAQSWHRDLWASVKRGDTNQCSFGFTVPDGGDEWGEDEDERGIRFAKRTLKSVNLLDCSAVTYPAYPATSVQARDASGVIASAGQLDLEAWRRATLGRAALIGKRIAADRIADTKVERVRRMGPEEFDRYARERAAELAEEILRGN